MQLLRFRLLPGLLLSCLTLLFFSLSAQKPITLEDIWQRGTFSAKGVPGFNFQQDGVHYTKLENGAIVQYDLRTGDKSGVLFDATTVTTNAPDWKGAFDGYSFSADESKLLLTTGTIPLFAGARRPIFLSTIKKPKRSPDSLKAANNGTLPSRPTVPKWHLWPATTCTTKTWLQENSFKLPATANKTS